MDLILIGLLLLSLYVHQRQGKRHKRKMALQQKAVLSQQRAISQLRGYISQENEAKMELYRILARYPCAAGAIQKILCLESQVASLRRLLQSRERQSIHQN